MSGEQYKLHCWRCGREITIPTEARSCSQCGAQLNLDWDSERRAYAGREPGGGRFSTQNAAETALAPCVKIREIEQAMGGRQLTQPDAG